MPSAMLGLAGDTSRETRYTWLAPVPPTKVDPPLLQPAVKESNRKPHIRPINAFNEFFIETSLVFLIALCRNYDDRILRIAQSDLIARQDIASSILGISQSIEIYPVVCLYFTRAANPYFAANVSARYNFGLAARCDNGETKEHKMLL